MALVIISLIGAALVYVSGITPGGELELPPGALGHASILASAFFLLLAAHYRLAMFGLLSAHNGTVFGAGATDLTVRLPGYRLPLVVCLLPAVPLLGNNVPAPWGAPRLAPGP